MRKVQIAKVWQVHVFLLDAKKLSMGQNTYILL